MTVTFATRLAGDDGRNLRKYVTIEGVKYVFQDGDVDVPSALLSSTYTRLKNIVALEQDRRELDMVARRAKGGGLRLRLLDDDDHTLRALFTMRKRRTTFIGANETAAGDGTITVGATTDLHPSSHLLVCAECIH